MRTSDLMRTFFGDYLNNIIETGAKAFATRIVNQYRDVLETNTLRCRSENWLSVLDVKLEGDIIAILLKSEWWGFRQCDFKLHIKKLGAKAESYLHIEAAKSYDEFRNMPCFWYKKIHSIIYRKDKNDFVVIFDNDHFMNWCLRSRGAYKVEWKAVNYGIRYPIIATDIIYDMTLTLNNEIIRSFEVPYFDLTKEIRKAKNSGYTYEYNSKPFKETISNRLDKRIENIWSPIPNSEMEMTAREVLGTLGLFIPH